MILSLDSRRKFIGYVMKINIGDILEEITLPNINGSNFSLSSLKGKKVLLTFYRFARCPMCNLRINEILKRYDELGKNFTMVGIFDSKINNLRQAMNRHDIPFTILADENFKYFEKYDVKTSWWGVIRASFTRFTKFNKALFLKGYIPFPIKGHFNTLPVDILIDEKGVVVDVKYAKDIGDHFSFEKLKSFSV